MTREQQIAEIKDLSSAIRVMATAVERSSMIGYPELSIAQATKTLTERMINLIGDYANATK